MPLSKKSRLTDRDLVTLSREGRTIDEIGDVYGIHPNHVRSRLRDLGLDANGQPFDLTTPVHRQRVVKFDRARDESWRDRALCGPDGGHDPAIWFPDARGRSNSNAYKEAVGRAKSLCAECPVLAECREAVMRAEATEPVAYRAGIVAGMTPRERVAIERGEVA